MVSPGRFDNEHEYAMQCIVLPAKRNHQEVGEEQLPSNIWDNEIRDPENLRRFLSDIEVFNLKQENRSSEKSKI